MKVFCPSRSRLKFSSKNIPFMNGLDVRPVQFSYEQTSAVSICTAHGCPLIFVIFNLFLLSKVFNRMSLGGLEDFLTEQENLASRTEPEREDTPAVRKHYLHGSFCGEQSREPGTISSGQLTCSQKYCPKLHT